MFSSRLRITPIALLLVVVGCGTLEPRPPEPARPEHVPSWPTRSWSDRHETMTFTVLPNMGQAWQAFTKSDAPTLTCRTCHGPDAEAVAYKMPNPSLPVLDPARLPSKTSRDPNEARWATFMFDDVVPRMTHLMDAAPYDPKTRTGFGCFDCHTRTRPK